MSDGWRSYGSLRRSRTDGKLNDHGAAVIRTATEQVCDGCGRTIPQHSHVIRWNCWDDGVKVRVRFCADCESVIYDCDRHGRVEVHDDGLPKKLLVARMCRSCQHYLSCDLASYLRTMNPDDTWWGGLDAR